MKMLAFCFCDIRVVSAEKLVQTQTAKILPLHPVIHTKQLQKDSQILKWNVNVFKN